jgi:hypothetical protein
LLIGLLGAAGFALLFRSNQFTKKRRVVGTGGGQQLTSELGLYVFSRPAFVSAFAVFFRPEL